MFSKIIALLPAGLDAISYSHCLGVLPIKELGSGDVDRWLTLVNMALVVECAKFIVESGEPAFEAKEAESGDVTLKKPGQLLFLIVRTVKATRRLGPVDFLRATHPMLTWLANMFEEVQSLDDSSESSSPREILCLDLCEGAAQWPWKMYGRSSKSTCHEDCAWIAKSLSEFLCDMRS